MATGHIKPEANLLHPLATLHWKHCHTWRGDGLPIDCAVLEDKVAILTRSFGSCDVLHISSTDLLLWTTLTLPYEQMSLTTYHSKFVTVGGCHPSTHECIGQLFTSDTGLKWEVSHPPMPTQRFFTSSVSTRSPEVLVVAGGWSGGWKLDVVEVLLGSHWHTVDPLPKVCWRMHSIIHDGNLYFIGGQGQYDNVYTCSCSSLISSCVESSNTMTKDRILWSQFKAPSNRNVAVSYSSYLVSIDYICIVRAYSSVTQSWVEATSTGNRSDGYSGDVAAAVLSTGELVYVHRYSGVYRGKLLVCSFSPDRRFISNVLSRLEAVMGVQIISVLANNHSQLITTSGVQQQPQVDDVGFRIPLPDPKKAPGQYVVEVISQWSAGRSYRPPTWGHLLEVLQDVGLSELSQQIDTFMKGEMKFIDAYRHFISTKEVLELLFLKFLFVGPPRLGKTTLRRRLMGEITDLLSAGEAEQTHPSTAAVESGHSVIVRSLSSTTAVITQAEWSAAQNLTEEARMLFHNFVDSIETSAQPKPTSAAEQSTSTTTVAETCRESSSTTTDGVHLAVRPEPSSLSKFISKIKSLKLGRKRKKYHDTSEIVADIPEVAAIIKESYHPEFWKEAKHAFKAYLRLEDTGGQPELMDMLPALTVGPGLYLLFFSYELDLKSEFKVFYQSATGETSLPECSSFTLEDMLLSTLSSISCSSSSIVAKEVASSDMQHILQSSKSVVYFVGTHKDKVSEAHVACFDEELQKIIRSTDFFEKDLVRFCSEDRLVISIDNMGGGVEEVNEVRKLLEVAMEDHFKKLRVPAVWLLFSLCLRVREVRTASIEECLQLSRLFNMSLYETNVALWFLHHHAGVMMYFPEVPGLEDLVIIDIQVVYDSVTHLILRAMRFGKLGQATAEKFRRSGQFSLKDLITATAGINGDFIPPLKLLALLEYLHIIARIFPAEQYSTSCGVEEETVYIMPCVLHSASKEELDKVFGDECRLQFIAPLMVRYMCGFVPIGVFPAMIASLIASKCFNLIERGMMKNLVQFHYGPLHALVTLVSHPRFYGIVLFKLPLVECEPHRLCVELRKEIECTLEKVSSHMNYGSFLDFQFAFECPTHPGREHLCVVNKEQTEPSLMLCLKDLHMKLPEKLSACHKVWFGEQLPHTNIHSQVDSAYTSVNLCDVITLRNIRQLKWIDHNGMEHGLYILKEISSDWKAIGDMLDISPGRQDTIEMNHPRDVEECCRSVLKDWLENKGTKTYSNTWKGFCKLLKDLELSRLGNYIYSIIIDPNNLFV